MNDKKREVSIEVRTDTNTSTKKQDIELSSIKLLDIGVKELLEKEERSYNEKRKRRYRNKRIFISTAAFTTLAVGLSVLIQRLHRCTSVANVVASTLFISAGLFISILAIPELMKPPCDDDFKIFTEYINYNSRFNCMQLMTTEKIIFAKVIKNDFLIAFDNNGEVVVKRYYFDVEFRTDIDDIWYDLRGTLYVPYTHYNFINKILNSEDGVDVNTYFTANEKLLNAINHSAEEEKNYDKQ